MEFASPLMGVGTTTCLVTNKTLKDMQELIDEIYKQNGRQTMLIDNVRDYLALKIHRDGSLYSNKKLP